MRITPVRLLILGVAVFAVGFGIGLFNVDPLSAWIGTAGMVVAFVALVWIGYLGVRSRTHRRGTAANPAEVE